jgi:excisionase family DNA binding protein
MAKLVPIKQVAEQFGISVWTIRREIAAGRLNAYRMGQKSIRLDPADVKALIRPM